MDVRVAAADDYDAVIAVVDGWWGRPISGSLPRLFLDHFWSSSQIAEDEQGLAGFLIGFVSPAQPEVGYIHFAGVRPDCRADGLARQLYEQFAEYARGHGCAELGAITSPANAASIRFHRRIGFAVSEPVVDYNGSGRAMVVFRRELDPHRHSGGTDRVGHTPGSPEPRKA
jgi:ribosomal protein S18 acetylase RimI-like enzyme